MFRQIRIRLVVQNTLVFFFIFLLSGSGLYLYMQHRLIEQVDSSMKQTDFPFSLKQAERGAATIRPNGGGAVNLRVVYLMWNEDGKLVQQLPEQAVADEDMELFHQALGEPKPTTLHSGDHAYRVSTVSLKHPILLRIPKQPFSDDPQEQLASLAPNAVSKVQFVRNIDTEQNTLNRLLMVLITGVVGGVGVALLAGFYLAGRALVPIRTSWEKQQQFVADASHELRTPLAVVQSHTELLLRHPDHTIAEESPKVAVIYKESKRMSKLVSDLLTLARSDSNQLEIERKPLLLDQTLGDVTEQFQQLAEVKEIEMQSHIAESIPWEADEARLRQLFVILLDNAIKFTPEG
ncbi:MAG: sensor histidine kinase, partial [Tumebacillaceae bacterium]